MSKKVFPNAVPLYRKLLFRTWDKWTAPLRALPDFLVIGVQKGGTSSLYRYLAQHPDIQMPFRKQLHYFDRYPNPTAKSYQKAFPLKMSLGNKMTFEATPYYIFHPMVPERVHQLLPEMKLVMMFRDPIDRAYSHYQMKKAQGWESVPTFKEALELEESRLQPELDKMAADPNYYSRAHRNFSYRSRGHYAEQLERWLRYFPMEQMLILNSEDFFADPMDALNQVYEFVGLSSFTPPDLKAYNSREYASLDPEVRAELQAHYRPHNEKLFDLIGRRFDWD
ncbi:MAG: sulfotransferase domain-containing protein [Bacteroidetes bacterium]|nr:sulfotransferase domain-containing protein [Bacteroidota bacterium]